MRIIEQTKKYPKFTVNQIKQNGITGIKNSITIPVFTMANNLSSCIDNRFQIGKPIWDEDWDVIIVLDACRVDLMRSVCDEYEFLPSSQNLETIRSIGSMSKDWIERTFSSDFQKYISTTAYVTGNCFTQKAKFECKPEILDEVWTYAWDDSISTIPARPITDRAIDTWQSQSPAPNKMIVHYMQPHVPFVNAPDIGDYGDPDDFGERFADIWSRVGEDIDYQTVWDAYLDNLRYALEDVRLLLNNIDANSVVITSDHGNAIGEWGLSGHPSGALHPTIRRVPWIETTASSDGSYTPNTKKIDRDKQRNVEERLSALGYK